MTNTLDIIKTPCIGVCSTALGGSVCRGCKRFAHEVIDWNSYSFEQKLAVEQRLVGFLTQLVQNHIEIVDEDTLQWQLDHQPVNVPTHRNLYCQAFVLIKAGASQIGDTAQFGFKLTPYAKNAALADICEQIDEAFYALSVAHYERCFVNFA